MRNRKTRRQQRQVLRFGKRAKRRHRRQAGRTGSIESKRQPGKHYGKGVVFTSPMSDPPMPPWWRRRT